MAETDRKQFDLLDNRVLLHKTDEKTREIFSRKKRKHYYMKTNYMKRMNCDELDRRR